MDADDELKLSLSAVVIATIAKKRKNRRQVRSCWVRPWICSRPRFGGYEALLMNVRHVDKAVNAFINAAVAAAATTKLLTNLFRGRMSGWLVFVRSVSGGV